MKRPQRAAEIHQLLDAMGERLREWVAGPGEWRIIGIHTGGIWIAEQLQQRLPIEVAAGQLNIAFYRDDFSRIGVHPHVEPSKLDFDVEGKNIILVDDILYTGRTVRAALNEIFDFGRPERVVLAVLVDRSGRELPIQADVVGAHLSLSAGEHVKLAGPQPLELTYTRKEV
jgi:pyrimidine operon attenuation protein/uracil phosphoribosyltransferase